MPEEHPEDDTLGETENYEAWVSYDGEGGEPVFHIETGRSTLHFFSEEWEEFLQLMAQLIDAD